MDDLYFRYMTQGSYRPEEWGHVPPKPRKVLSEKQKKKEEKAKLKKTLAKLESEIDSLLTQIETAKRAIHNLK